MYICARLGAALMLFACAATGVGVQSAPAQKVSSAEVKKDIVAPEVIVFSPHEERTVVDKPEFTVGVVAHSLTQTTEIEIRITLVNKAGRVEKTLPARQKTEVSHRITLAQGENVLTFVARNEKAESKPLTRVIVYTPRDAGQDDLLYLGIGVSKYARLRPEPHFAARDADDLSRLLVTQQGGQVFDNVDVKVLLDSDVTRENVIKGLYWVVDKADEPEDVAIVFIAGHLHRDKSGEYFLLTHGHQPSEDMEIGDVNFNSAMRILSKAGGRVVLLIDGSASLDDTGFGQLARLAGSTSNIALCLAAGGGGVALESPELKHGVFAGALFEGLGGKADTNNDSFVDSGELQLWLRRRVPELSQERQQPACVTPPDFAPFRIFHSGRP